MKRNSTMLVLVLLLAIGAILMLSKSPIARFIADSEVPRCPGCNVVMILIDTLRADHLPCYGYERDTAPNICGLAEEGFLFRNMFANSPSTKTSVASLFTSMLPSQHKSIFNEDILNDDVTTMAEILARHGYHTYAVNGNPVIKLGFNYDQGFASWKDNLTRPTTRDRMVFESLAELEQPFFAYLHYMDPHSPYVAPQGYYRFFNPDYRGEVTGRSPYDVSYFEERPDELEQLVNFYDNEIRYVDHRIGELFERLKAAGLYENSVIILLADHGEGFLDHGRFAHSNSVYHELIDVPLIIRPPKQKKRVVDTPVQTIDILPTLLAMLGIEEEHAFMGQSIFPLRGVDEDRPIISEQLRLWAPSGYFPETALILGRFKLIKQMTTNDYLLFDMHEDPLERENVVERAANAAELTERLESLLQTNAAMYGDVEAKETTLDEETTQQLKELGYIE